MANEPSPKKKGFFRRLSLSSSAHKAQAQVSSSSSSSNGNKAPRSVSGTLRKDARVVAGPAYDTLPAGAAPNVFKVNAQTNQGQPTDYGPLPPMPPAMPPHVPMKSSRTQNRTTNVPVQTPPRQMGRSPPSVPIESPHTPKRTPTRNPIHPALASPPRNAQHHGTGPYDVKSEPYWKQNYVPTQITSPHSSRSSPQNGMNMSNLKAALPNPPAGMPRSVSNTSGRFEDAEGSSDPMPPYIPQQSPRSTHPAGSPRTAGPSSYFPPTQNPMPSVTRTNSETPSGMSEASAYAKAMSSKAPPESSTPPASDKMRKSSRPLPKPPGQQPSAPVDFSAPPQPVQANSRRDPPAQVNARHFPSPPSAPVPTNGPRFASPSDAPSQSSSRYVPPPVIPPAQPNGRAPAPTPETPPHPNGHFSPPHKQSPEKPRPKVLIPPSRQEKRVSVKPYQFEFSRSPTLPPLVDPRSDLTPSREPLDQWAPPSRQNVSPPGGPPIGGAPSLLAPVKTSESALPQQLSSFSSPMAMSPTSPIARQRKISNQSRSNSNRHLLKRSGKPSLAFLLSFPTIQSSFLPWLTINSFLSLTGCSDEVRKQLSGELVGRWILNEWALSVDREKGRSWPNLTVWEGFVESLLHDPATYCTYPPQWHGLLSHLSLSHTLIVLHLRNLPATAFPYPTPLPFEDESSIPMVQLSFSHSANSLSSMNLPIPRSRAPSRAGSDGGSIAPSARNGGPPPKAQERLVEIVMPEPLAAKPQEELVSFAPPTSPKPKLVRKNSRSSIISTSSFGIGRRRANSVNAKDAAALSPSSATLAAPMPGKRELPPVSFPAAKRYTFTRHGDAPSSTRTRTMSGGTSSRPGSIFSVASSPSGTYQPRMSIGPASRPSFAVDRNAPPVPTARSPGGLMAPTPGQNSHRSSFASSDGRSNRVSEFGGYSPVNPKSASPFPNRGEFLSSTPPPRLEQAFERPPPYTIGRAPILRVFVPLSERVRRWPSAEGAAASVKELDKCGATRRLKLGDLVVNTAIKYPKHTEHVLLFVPYIKHLLVPLEYKYSETGHLPSYLDAFSIPPSYYYPFLPTPQIIFLNLAPYCIMAMGAIRLAFDRRDVTTTSGARISAKRYLHVTGFEVCPGDNAAPEWQGMVSLESEGTAEGKMELEQRLGGGDPNRATMGPWEVVREKSMMGTIWLRLIKLQE